MEAISLLTLLALILALVFDFINGFHDAGNAIATIVTTKVLTPRKAVLWAALFNFSAFLVFNLSVASTIGKGLVAPELMEPHVIVVALIAAIFWNLLTWYFGLPSSSSHALIGGLAGAAVAKAGFNVLIPSGFIKVLIGIIIAPIIGIFIGLLMMRGIKRLLEGRSERKAQKIFKHLQLFSSACLSLTHGGNDAQKTMGIITLLLVSADVLKGPFHIPFWVVIICQATISLGTLFGGWRVVKTMGSKITTLNPMKGCAAEGGAAALLFVATECGIPMSTTQTVTGAIAGVGLAKDKKSINWAILTRIFISWLLTMPIVGLMAALIMYLIEKFGS